MRIHVCVSSLLCKAHPLEEVINLLLNVSQNFISTPSLTRLIRQFPSTRNVALFMKNQSVDRKKIKRNQSDLSYQFYNNQ